MWLYVNKDTDLSYVEKAEMMAKQLENTPIIIMLLNDSDNRLYDSLLEYDVLDKLDDLNRNKYDRYYQADFGQAENNLKDEFAELKKQRIHLGANGTEEIKMRMPMYLTSVFEELYPDAIPFSFDGFVTKGKKNADDVEMLIDNIASVLQKGIPDADRLDFEELQKNLSELLSDINEIKRVTNSRNEFKKISEDMINKYEHSEFDFEVLPIIHEVISDMENNMNVREQEWINSVLTLGDKSRKAVHKWKEKTAYLPEYLSEETIEKVKMVDKEADEIIREGKIEDVLFYFDKLDDVEKLECIQKLQNRLNR